MDETQEPGPLPAVRLIFEYDGDDVRLVSQQPVDVAVPGADLARELFPGHYVETRDANNAPLARVPARVLVYSEHAAEDDVRGSGALPASLSEVLAADVG